MKLASDRGLRRVALAISICIASVVSRGQRLSLSVRKDKSRAARNVKVGGNSRRGGSVLGATGRHYV